MKNFISLTYDASSYGVGYVLSYLMPDGREAPIAYASRTLTSTERNYSQLDKEALSIIAGVKKFHYFLYGHNIYSSYRSSTTPWTFQQNEACS
ncbi:hypothetical protein AVEN_94395-1 [Araneus ventricosus]|uniref:Reverse transcriptase/retrotransposon-derived protein RNase H-like domain-containing protein n=1 Tax=Araneus ventricosus TaxID=182803 RepID=A0A4Y2ECE8_ARAVE|nr:hypothetical protein AVEN_94395-1 [Araneus ventricosus]